MLKQWHWSEQGAIQFRTEFFNAFNRPNFGLPNDPHEAIPRSPA